MIVLYNGLLPPSELKYLSEIFYADKEEIGVHPIPFTGNHILLGYLQPVVEILCTDTTDTHGDEIQFQVFRMNLMFIKQTHHHVIVGCYVIVKGIQPISLVYFSLDIE